MTDRELMQQALEALEGLADAWTEAFRQRKYNSDEPEENAERERVLGAIAALRERLAQPEQEPVAYTTGHCENHKQKGGCQLHNLQCGWPDCDRKPITAPQRREWVGLTRDEVLDIEETHPLAFYRAIEAKLKEKNT